MTKNQQENLEEFCKDATLMKHDAAAVALVELLDAAYQEKRWLEAMCFKLGLINLRKYYQDGIHPSVR